MSDTEQEAIRFLDRDFNQCFEQMRHYDSQIFEIGKFTLASYAGIIGLALGLYQFSLKESVELRPPARALLAIGLLHGFLLLGMAVRNRAYFVKVARYINEQRKLFLSSRPMGFQNESQMYVDQKYPKYYDWRSSQLWLTHLVAALNSVLLALLLAVGSDTPSTRLVAISGLIVLVAQVLMARSYLRSYEPKKGPEQDTDEGSAPTSPKREGGE
jgi:hypothetical protein